MRNTESFKWDERLSLGISPIDKDHQRLFSIIRKILVLSSEEDYEKVKHAVKEGLKFFISYTMSHFQREEDFMLSNQYPDYSQHKKMHDDLKYNTLPSLKLSLEESDYEVEEIRHFLGVCVGWLSTHIMMMDQAIVHPKQYQSFDFKFTGEQEKIEKAVKKVVFDLYQMDSELISNHYTGWDFGKVIFYEITVKSEGKKGIHLLYVLEEKLIFNLASQRMGMEIKRIDTYLITLMKEILSKMASQMAYYLNISGEFKQRTGYLVESSEVETIYRNKSLIYSSLFSTKEGKFAFSVYQR